MLRGLPRGPPGAVDAGRARACDLFPQRRMRLVAGLPRSMCPPDRGRVESYRNVGQPRGLPSPCRDPGGGAGMESMSPTDTSFLHIEGPNTPMHIGAVSIFEGPAPPFARLEELVLSKLDAVPRYRQKVRFVPLALGRPVWVDDPHFNLGYHLRHSALPAPGTEEVLRRTAARIFAQHLDRRKPLWEIWMVEGLSENRWALLSKVHHCMVDGVSATDLMTVMFDDSPPQPPEERWQAAPEPTDAELVLHTLTRQVFNPSAQLRAMRAAVRRPRASLAKVQAPVRGVG